MNLFVYGTLMDRRVMMRIVGRPLPPAAPAVLYGYRKWETTLGYPAVFPDPGQSCKGSVYGTLTADDLKRLDAYEDVNGNPPAYTRRLVTVQGAHGSLSAYLYIGNLGYFRARLKRT